MDLREVRIPCLRNLEALEMLCNNMGLHLSYKPEAFIFDAGDASNEIFEVEKIVDYAKDPFNNEWYFVKWKGWPSKNNSWEPKKNLVDCRDLLKKFNATRCKQESKPVKTMKSFNSSKSVNFNGLEKYFTSLGDPLAKSFFMLLKKANFNTKNKNNGLNGLFELKKTNFKAKNNHNKLKKPDVCDFVIKRWLEYQDVQKKLRAWEMAINSVTCESAPIVVENYVDLEGPPDNFTYINDYKPGEGIIIPDDPLVGCECLNCYDNRKKCCSTECGGLFAYTRFGRVNVKQGTPIYECNKRCKCPPTCLNRVVQHGRKIKLAIFRTSNGCGWGVKTLEPIKKDTFVMEYVGEVITNEEAEKRGEVYDAQGRTYLFDLDYNDGDCPFTVDAASYGNVSHFMNHSCNPNLVVYAVWINILDPRLPKLAFFTNKEIKTGEELTFDYMMTKATSNVKKNRIPCKCGSQGCRKYLV